MIFSRQFSINFTGSAAGLLHHNHQTGQDNSSNLDGNIKNSGNGSDNITAENETDNATADESSNGPIKVSIVMTVALREELLKSVSNHCGCRLSKAKVAKKLGIIWEIQKYVCRPSTQN